MLNKFVQTEFGFWLAHNLFFYGAMFVILFNIFAETKYNFYFQFMFIFYDFLFFLFRKKYFHILNIRKIGIFLITYIAISYIFLPILINSNFHINSDFYRFISSVIGTGDISIHYNFTLVKLFLIEICFWIGLLIILIPVKTWLMIYVFGGEASQPEPEEGPVKFLCFYISLKKLMFIVMIFIGLMLQVDSSFFRIGEFYLRSGPTTKEHILFSYLSFGFFRQYFECMMVFMGGIGYLFLSLLSVFIFIGSAKSITQNFRSNYATK
jgi:hypothetical protein